MGTWAKKHFEVCVNVQFLLTPVVTVSWVCVYCVLKTACGVKKKTKTKKSTGMALCDLTNEVLRDYLNVKSLGARRSIFRELELLGITQSKWSMN